MAKKILLLAVTLVIAGVFTIESAQAGSLGSPTASLDPGQFSAGLELFKGEMDLELSGASSGTLTDLESERKLGVISYGATEWWEIFVRVGVGDAEVDNMHGETRTAYGVGTRVTLVAEEPLSWGALFSIDWLESEDKLSGTISKLGTFSNAKVDIEWYEIRVAAGPKYKQDNWCLYGGPFFFMLDGDMKIGTSSYDLEEESNIGGYIGGQIDITQKLSLAAEYQFSGDLEAIGLTLSWRF